MTDPLFIIMCTGNIAEFVNNLSLNMCTPDPTQFHSSGNTGAQLQSLQATPVTIIINTSRHSSNDPW